MHNAESNISWSVGTEDVCLRLSPGKCRNRGELRLIRGHTEFCLKEFDLNQESRVSGTKIMFDSVKNVMAYGIECSMQIKQSSIADLQLCLLRVVECLIRVVCEAAMVAIWFVRSRFGQQMQAYDGTAKKSYTTSTSSLSITDRLYIKWGIEVSRLYVCLWHREQISQSTKKWLYNLKKRCEGGW